MGHNAKAIVRDQQFQEVRGPFPCQHALQEAIGMEEESDGSVGETDILVHSEVPSIGPDMIPLSSATLLQAVPPCKWLWLE